MPMTQPTGYFKIARERLWHIRVSDADPRRYTAGCGYSTHLESGTFAVEYSRTADKNPGPSRTCRVCIKALKEST